MFRAINVREVQDCIMNLNINKSTTGFPARLLKIAHLNITEALAIVFTTITLLSTIYRRNIKLTGTLRHV